MSGTAEKSDGQGHKATGGQRGKNMAASVRTRLTALAHAQGEETEYLLTRYALERLLYRLAQSPYATTFVLKGALLFALWEDHPHRATRDVDLLGFGPPEVDRIEQIFRDLCALPVDDDGVTFLPETVHARRIREQQEYGGIRVILLAALGTVRLRLQADVGFGDVVTPAPQMVSFPTLLDLPAPHLRAYPRETVVAEKYEAMARLGLTNSRMKDFYDLVALSRQFAFEGSALLAAMRATFTRRRTDFATLPPAIFTAEFAGNAGKRAEWQGFLKRSKLDMAGLPLEAIVTELRDFLMPLTDALIGGVDFAQLWTPEEHWHPLTKGL